MQIIKTSYVKTIGGIALLAGLGFVGLQKGNVASDEETALEPISKSEAPATVTTKPEVNLAKDISSKAQDDTAREESDPFEGLEVKYRFQQVAAQFAEDIKYPVFSKPIRNEHELAKYLPNRSISSSMAVNVEDPSAEPLDDSPRVSLKASKYRYFKGEPLLAEAEITGLSEADFVGLSAYVLADREVIADALEITKADGNENQTKQHFTIRFDDLSDLASGHKGDMRIVAEFNVSGQAFAISTPVQYPQTVAALEEVGSPKVESEYLIIPMHVATESPGLHAIKANLYDAESGTPLAHLNARKDISSEGVINLKAHIVTLKKMGYEGPYELRDVALSRGPSEPKYITERGIVPLESYSIAGFPFSQYEDIPYFDERAQARLDFLTQLGSVN